MAPRYGLNLKPGYGVTAENCDLADGSIKPMADSLLIQSDTNKYNSLYFHDSAFVFGNNKHYLSWKIGDNNLMIHLVSGVPYKGGELLGQAQLGAPTVAVNGTGSLTGKFTYFITTTRNIMGMTDESGPSTISSEITVSENIIRITRPTISDTKVTLWTVYRISQDSGEWQFVAEVNADETTYDDNNLDSSLSGTPTTYYTSDQGNEIIHDIPQTTFDGLSTKPQAGLIFAWNGSTLYWNEPGLPDAWPSFYTMNFPADIKRVIPVGGAWAVLTAIGPFRLDGTHPELLQQSLLLGEEPCIGTAACEMPGGVAYLSDSGIVLFDLTQTQVLTDGGFTEKWFKDNVTASTAFMVENDNKVYLFHSNGVLIGDLRVSPYIWSTLDIIAYAAHNRKDNGELYYIDDNGVQQLEGGAGYLTWTWQSGDLIGKTPEEKIFDAVEVIGSVTITATLYVEEVQKAAKALSFDMIRNRTLGFPEESIGRAMQIKLAGTGTVTEIIWRYAG